MLEPRDLIDVVLAVLAAPTDPNMVGRLMAEVGRTTTTPFAILAKVKAGRLTFMQFMEDTFATAMSFHARGIWHFESDPEVAK